MLLVAIEGLSGGYSYVSMFSCVGTDDEEVRMDLGLDERKKRREFRIACVGFADVGASLALLPSADVVFVLLADKRNSSSKVRCC